MQKTSRIKQGKFPGTLHEETYFELELNIMYIKLSLNIAPLPLIFGLKQLDTKIKQNKKWFF